MKRLLLVAAIALVAGWWLRPVPSPDTAELARLRQVAAQARAKATQDSFARAVETRKTNRMAQDVARAAAAAARDRDSVTKLTAAVQLLSMQQVVVHQRDTVAIPPQVGALLQQQQTTIASQDLAIAKYKGLEQQWATERAAFLLEGQSFRAAADSTRKQHTLELKVAYDRGKKIGRLQGAAFTLTLVGGGVYVGLRF
jgi:hypothetical protein